MPKTQTFKAFEKRNKTLLIEYKNQFKSNKFTDKRLGEHDTNLTLEDKIFKRFVAERQKKSKRTNKYNLNDDDENDLIDSRENEKEEELTHLGQSLSQIERFERIPQSDDEDEDEEERDERKRKEAQFTAENFFGGGGKNDDGGGEPFKNRKEWIDEMIQKSKQIKYEKRKERDITLDLTEQLDKEWKQLLPNLKLNKLEHEYSKVTPDPKDYDCLVKELHFESIKAHATDKLKTDQELEQEKLDALKLDQLALVHRMNVEVEEEDETNNNKNIKNKKQPHYSVDDMEFNDIEYLQQSNKNEIKKKQDIERKEDEQKKKETSSEEEEEDEEKEEKDEEEKEDASALNVSEMNLPKILNSFEKEKWLLILNKECSRLLNRKLFNTPTLLDQFQQKILKELLNSQSLDPSRNELNRHRLLVFVNSLLNLIENLSISHLIHSSQDKAGKAYFAFLNKCTQCLADLLKKHAQKSTKGSLASLFIQLFVNKLKTINEKLFPESIVDNKLVPMPSLGTLMTLKLIGVLFPTSDFRHRVTTPAMLLLARCLTQCTVRTIGECVRGCFLCHILLEYVNKSDRLVPECIRFLSGVLYLAIDQKNDSIMENYKFELSTLFETFKRTALNLRLNKKIEKLDSLHLFKADDKLESSDSVKASTLAYALDLLKQFVNKYESNQCFREMFVLPNAFLNNENELFGQNQMYPDELKKRVEDMKLLLTETIDLSEMKKEHLKCWNKKPTPLILHEPKIQTKSKFDPRHHNSVISEKQLMRRKVKKEYKSAIKEIRHDNQFIARVQLDEQMKTDAKRAAKVKEIMGGLANQEGDYQRVKRMKS